MEMIDGFTVAAGIINAPFTDNNWDFNSGKALTSQVGYSSDKYGATVGVNWGREGNSTLPAGTNGSNNDSTGIVDVLLTADRSTTSPCGSTTTTSGRRTASGSTLPTARSRRVLDTSTQAIAIAGRLGVLETTGIALRFEYLQVDVENDFLGPTRSTG